VGPRADAKITLAQLQQKKIPTAAVIFDAWFQPASLGPGSACARAHRDSGGGSLHGFRPTVGPGGGRNQVILPGTGPVWDGIRYAGERGGEVQGPKVGGTR